MPLEQLLESIERARLDAKLKYVVIHGAACSYCLARAQRLDGSYLRTFALELKEQLAQTLTAFVTSILAGPRMHPDTESGAVNRFKSVSERKSKERSANLVTVTHQAVLLRECRRAVSRHRYRQCCRRGSGRASI